MSYRSTILLMATCLALSAVTGVGGMLAAPAEAAPSGVGVEADRFLVTFDPTASPRERTDALERLGTAGSEALGGDVAVVRTDVTMHATELGPLPPGVAAVEADLPMWNPDAVPNDPMFGSEWGLHAINAPAAWNVTTGASNVIVAVIDTGVDIGHPDLAGHVWRNPADPPNGRDDDFNGYVDDSSGYDFAHNDASVYDPGDGDAHGTHVAGTIGAVSNNGIGVAGVAWNVTIMPLKFITPGGGYTSNAVRAINYAVARGARVINASWGGSGFSAALKAAIDAAANAGVVFVAAAGNSSSNTDSVAHYPSSYTSANIVSVAASNPDGTKAGFSNYGPTSVDIAAPGANVLSTVPGGYQYYSGTSMAAPHVSGVVALLRTVNPRASAAQIRSLLLGSALRSGSWSGLVATGATLNALAATGQAGDALAYGAQWTGGVFVAAGQVVPGGDAEVVVGADDGGGPHVRVMRRSGTEVAGFFAYPAGFRGGVRVGTGDVDGDGAAEIVTGAGAGGGPHVRAISTRSGVREVAGFFAYSPAFTGGVYVAGGDVDGDGVDEIVTGAGAGGGPHVRAISTRSGVREVAGFLAYSPSFSGGVRVAACDVDGDGDDEVVTAPGRGGGPHVRIFDVESGSVSELAGFAAYGGGFTGGVYLACTDVDGNGRGDVVTGAGEGGGPHARILSYDPGARSVREIGGYYVTYPTDARGLRPAAGQLAAGGAGEVAFCFGPGWQPWLYYREVDGTALG